MHTKPAGRLGGGLVLTLIVICCLAGEAAGQAPPPGDPEAAPATTASPVPDPSDPRSTPPVVERPPSSASPQPFVVLSLLGAATALAIMAGQWIRTRARARSSPPGSCVNQSP